LFDLDEANLLLSFIHLPLLHVEQIFVEVQRGVEHDRYLFSISYTIFSLLRFLRKMWLRRRWREEVFFDVFELTELG